MVSNNRRPIQFYENVNLYKSTEVINLSGTKENIDGAVCKNLVNGKVKLIKEIDLFLHVNQVEYNIIKTVILGLKIIG